MCGFEKFLLKLYIAEGMAVFVALCGKVVVIFHRCLLHCGKVGLGRRAADHERDMIGRTCGSAESLHLFDQERHERLLVEDGLCLLIEIGLVGRAATLGHEEEVILHTLGGVNLDLGGKIAAGVHLIVHREGGVLRIAEIILGISLVDTLGNLLLVVATRPDLLTLVAGADRRARILTEREHALGGYVGIAEHRESHVFVVFGCFRVVKDLCHQLIVFAAKHERAVMGGDVCEDCQSLRINHEHLVAVPVLYFHIVGRDVLILGGIRSQREHFLVMKRFCCHCYISNLSFQIIQYLAQESRSATLFRHIHQITCET